MSFTSIQSLQTLLEHAQAQRDESLRLLQEAQTRARQAQDQQDQLRQYQQEYQQRWSTQFRQPATVQLVGCYQSFGLRLNQAIDQQQHIAGYAEQRLKAARQRVQEQEMRVASIRKLIEHRQLDIQRRNDRVEQRLADEHAARSMARAVPFAGARL
ncbi:flagellar export protein FliJ [Roseateles sp. BYS180W]|uniref:Flagellar FliJ protein n=1 Tax=Roseateles rivi TaxID=3299028 RepID=A0ABW7FV38_9BURK